jgi:Bacterial Ig domain
VHGVNDDPHAVDDTADAAQSDDPVAISIDVLANDTDVDGDALALVGVSTPDHGTATVEANHILFTPEAGFVGDATFTYTVEDESEASDTATVTVTVAPDVSGPTVLAPTQTILAPAVPTRSSVMVRFSWPVGSDISGVASYEAQLSTDDGPWVDVSGPSMTRQLDGMLVVSHVYRLRVRATDGLGNVSAWKQGPRFGVKAWQTPAFTYKKHWTIVEATSSTGTGFRYSTVKGAKATISGEGRSFAWVAPKNAKSGKAKVYVDGHYVATINLHASTSVARRVVWSITFASVGEHRVTIVNQGTHGHSRVSLDALVVLR